jgi:hypothetical protein
VAYLDSVIFQRTDSGSAEIRRMKLQLKKSERLVLVTVDGISTYLQLRTILNTMAQERLDRALFSLQARELVSEVLFPVDEADLEVIDPATMKLFLSGTVDELSRNSGFQVDAALEAAEDNEFESQLDYPGSHLSMPLSSVISSSSSEGLSVNTRKGRTSPLLDQEAPSTIGLDFSKLVDGLAEKRQSHKTKIVQVFPQPERRKKRRKSGPRKVIKNSWHIYAYYVVFTLAILLIVLSVLERMWR